MSLSVGKTLPGAAPARQCVSAHLLIAVVIAAPVCFGSTDATTMAAWCVILGVAVAFAPLNTVAPRHLALFLAAVSVTVACYAFVLHEQLAQKPWIASPDPIWEQAKRLLDVSVASSVAVARNEPFLALGNSLNCLLALVCGFAIGGDRATARRLLRVIAVSGAGLALYGIVAYAADPTHIFWRDKVAYREVLTATFVNRNTAAVYFGSCAVAWLIFLSERTHGWSLRWRSFLGDFLHHLDRKTTFYFVGLFLCLAAVFMTASRAGTAISLLALAVASVKLFRAALSKRSGALISLAVFGLVGLTLLQIMGAGVRGRLDLEGLGEGGRIQTYAATLKMIGDHPWFGVGLGNFAWSYPAYRGDEMSMWGVWDRAHSTPLELAAEVGLPLTFVVCTGWLLIFVLLGRRMLSRERTPAVALAAFCVSMIAVLHSAMDFSLQVPGYSIPIFALAGAGVAQSLRARSLRPRLRENNRG
jgi:O-antigen ligase